MSYERKESKEPPSTEYSLNNISWHLKQLVIEIKDLNTSIIHLKTALKSAKIDEINF